MTRLSAVSLRKAYGSKVAVADISLHIDAGEIVGLLGANGAGKTTCFYMIVGLLRADAGQISLGDRDVTTTPCTGERARASAICRRRPASSAV